ncbi:MAG: response regulator [Rhodospirillaceae bacterium]|nr:response regulator [Rhodospirillaceae bacterium]
MSRRELTTRRHRDNTSRHAPSARPVIDPLVFGLAVATLVMAGAASLLGPGPGATVPSMGAVALSVAATTVLLHDRQIRRRRGERLQMVLRAVQDAPDPSLITTFGGTITFANTAANDRIDAACGVDAAEIADWAAAFWSAETAADTARQLAADAARDGILRTEVSETRDGEPRWTRITIRVPADTQDTLHWSFEDITADRVREQAMREAQDRLVSFMDQAPVGFYSVDAEGRFQFSNATLANWLGLSVTDLIDGSHRLHDFLVDVPEEAPPYAVLSGEVEPLAVDVKLRGRQGRVFQASIAQIIVRDGDGAVHHTRSLVRDLTPERQIREALRASEVRFQRFFEDAPIGIALVDANLSVTEWNRAFQSLVAVEGPLAGRPIVDFLAEIDREKINEALSLVLDGGDPESPIEVHFHPTSAAVRIGLMFARRMEGGPGDGDGLLLQFIDHTEQRALESQFAQSQKMQAVGQLAGGIAHDFNNLLTAMIGFSDLLLMRHKPGDPSFSDIMQIKQNANRAANLVRQLLAFSRQQTLQPKTLVLSDALSDLSNLLRRLIGENIELKIRHGRDVGAVKVDEGQFEQVIINLAVNARDAMTEGGTLTIETAAQTLKSQTTIGNEVIPAGTYSVIHVRDTGAGIPPDIVDRIFDPFFSTKRVGSGTGLGLSTVYGIVRQTGGYVVVDSAPGKGATFSIYLPAHRIERDVPAEQETTAPPSADLTGAGRILLVEDEDPVRMFGGRALRNKGYEVIEARSGEEALTWLEEDGGTIELLITDVIMPRMDGPTLIRHVRERQPKVRVLCISGYTEERLRERVGLDVDVSFLAKPFSLKQLAATVKEVLQSRSGDRIARS